MKMTKLIGVFVALAGVVVLAVVIAPAVHAQIRGPRNVDPTILIGRGATIGITVRDVDANQKTGGVVVDEVRPESAAEKAGVKRSDVITEFDGEKVRGARQFMRLVRETPAGRTVKATLLRDGQKKDVQITPSDDRQADLLIDGDRLRERLGDLATRLPAGIPGLGSRGRLGVTVEELSPQLADYFGARNGVLVSAVTEDSAASRGGLKAGDVITSINAAAVHTRADLMRALAVGADSRDVTIGIVRDKKESTLKATLDPAPAGRRSARRVL
jgi:serine protease Do